MQSKVKMLPQVIESLSDMEKWIEYFTDSIQGLKLVKLDYITRVYFKPVTEIEVVFDISSTLYKDASETFIVIFKGFVFNEIHQRLGCNVSVEFNVSFVRSDGIPEPIYYPIHSNEVDIFKEEKPMTAEVPKIKRVIHSNDWTIVEFKDGVTTRVKKMPDTQGDPIAAFCYAICKRLYGNNESFSKVVDLHDLKCLSIKEQEKVLKAKAERKARADRHMAKHERRVARRQAKENK